MNPDKSQQQIGRTFSASTPEGKSYSDRHKVPVKSRLGRKVSLTAKTTSPATGRKRTRSDSLTCPAPKSKRVSMPALQPDPGEKLPLLLETYRRQPTDRAEVIKNDQTFDEVHDWLIDCTTITSLTPVAAELLCENFKTQLHDKEKNIERIHKLEALSEKLHTIQPKNHPKY